MKVQRLRRLFRGGIGLGFMLFTLASPAAPLDQHLNVTFSGPVRLPGKVLPAGSYIFELFSRPSRSEPLSYSSRSTLSSHKGLPVRYAFALDNCQHLIRCNGLNSFHCAHGPADFKTVCAVCGAKSEVDAEVVLAQVA